MSSPVSAGPVPVREVWAEGKRAGFCLGGCLSTCNVGSLVKSEVKEAQRCLRIGYGAAMEAALRKQEETLGGPRGSAHLP